MVKWHEVNMNRSDMRAMYEKEMFKDVTNDYVERRANLKPEEPIYMFFDDFESGWFSLTNFINIKLENFDNDWFIMNQYNNNMFNDLLESDWFIVEQFNDVLFNEDFQNGGW